jgi:Escherichia/Staphylococcus phage prohead protease
MMLHRSYLSGPLEIREDGRTITGLAAPYGTPVEIHEAGRSYTESLVRGAFADDTTSPNTIPLMARHPKSDDTLPIGVTLTLREENDGLHGDWKVSKTELGDEVLELVRDGAISGLSIGFIPNQDRWSTDKRNVQRVRAHLDHVAIVRVPAYPTARIMGVRAAQASTAPLTRLALRRR